MNKRIKATVDKKTDKNDKFPPRRVTDCCNCRVEHLYLLKQYLVYSRVPSITQEQDRRQLIFGPKSVPL